MQADTQNTHEQEVELEVTHEGNGDTTGDTNTHEQEDGGLEANTPNSPFTKDKVLREMAKFGKAYGQGANSRPAMAERAVEAAHKINDCGPDDAEKFYGVFQQAAHKAKGIEYKAEGSLKQQVSKLRQFMIMGANLNIDGPAVFERAKEKIAELASLDESPLKGSAYDNLCNVARAQNQNPDEELTSDEIEAILSPTQEEKTVLDKLLDLYKKMDKLAASDQLPRECAQTFGEAQTTLGIAIGEAGGTLPERKETKGKGEAVAALKLRAKAIAATRQAKNAALCEAVGAANL